MVGLIIEFKSVFPLHLLYILTYLIFSLSSLNFMCVIFLFINFLTFFIHLRLHGEEVRLMLWDSAGQEEIDAITKAYYRGAQACVIAFSTTDRDSLLAVKSWRGKVEDECGDIPMVMVQNKIDMIAQSEINQ